MNLFMRQFTDQKMHNMTFCYDDEGKPPTWRRLAILNQWKTNRAASQTYSRILDANEIEWLKVTHMRTAGMERASAQGGLNAEQIATLSKHRAERIFEAYLTELMPSVLQVMAGLRQNDPYVVPRTEVELPFDPQVCLRLVFPQIDHWRMQLSLHNGDQHQSAHNFLYGTLPFLAKVLFQDFPYWFALNPEHEFCRMFRSKMPANFEVAGWAQNCTRQATQILNARDAQSVQNLNDGARAAFDQLARNLVQLHHKHESRLSRMEEKLEKIADEVRALSQQRHQELQQLQNQNQVVQIVVQQQGQQAFALPQQLQQQEQPVHILQQQQPHLQQPLQQEQLERANPNAQPAQRQQEQAVLQRVPVIPAIPSKLPETFRVLLIEHRDLQLQRYLNRGTKSHWPLRIRNAYSKRMYLFKKLEARAKNPQFRPQVPMANFNLRLDEAAHAVDQEMRQHGLSMDKKMKEWKESNTPRRNRNHNA